MVSREFPFQGVPAVKKYLISQLVLLMLVLGGCSASQTVTPAGTMLLATTTSTQDSGLLDAILPVFEAETGITVEVVAVGTGQALALGESGDADVVLVHAPSKEIAFVEAGHGTQRYAVMYNDFIIVGPGADPAGAGAASSAADALKLIAASEAPFASRGDDSGTHTKELSLWDSAGVTPKGDWYSSLGQGMGETLNFANETIAYTLTDRGTFLALKENLPNLSIIFGGEKPSANPDASLLNYYSVIPVNPETHPGVNNDFAMQFVEWLVSADTQKLIGEFGLDKFGIPLFFPNAEDGD